MPNSKGNRPGIKVFVDSSVLLAAVLSPSGGAFRILQEARERKILIFLTAYVRDEVEGSLKDKYPKYIPYFQSFFLHFPLYLVPEPPVRLVEHCRKMVHYEDAPILAAALDLEVDYLLTFDKRHLLQPLKRYKFSVRITTPAEFIKKYFV